MSADIRQALTYIPADDRDLWLRTGMAIHSELGADGFALWDEWSQCAKNYRAADARAVWKSFKAGSVRIGTLFYEAQQRGFKPTGLIRPPIRHQAPRPMQPQPVQHLHLAAHWRDVWQSLKPIAGEARAYLEARRCAIPPADGHLRWSPSLKHPSGYEGPALVGLVTDAISKQPITLHRTWIKPDGEKADIQPPRMLLGNHRKQGGCIRLWPDEAVEGGLGIAEGIETALTVAEVFKPVWALIDAGNLGAFPVLDGINSLLILADNDPAGLRASDKCATRWYEAKRQVRIAKSPVPHEDLNDYVRRVA